MNTKNICMPKYLIVWNVMLSMTVVDGLWELFFSKFLVNGQHIIWIGLKYIFHVKFRDYGLGKPEKKYKCLTI